jgi:hypothetical protein
VPLRQFGRAFDVGEGERHDAGRRRDILGGSVYGNDGTDTPAARPSWPANRSLPPYRQSPTRMKGAQ